MLKNLKTPLAIVFVIVLIDQIIKIYIKTHFRIGDEILVCGQDWFRIHFIENKGMAFGMAFGGMTGKVLLTSFRIIFSVVIVFYLNSLVKKNTNKLTIYAFSLILAGALGNIIDSLFYGIIFSESTPFAIASAFQGNGYAPVFCGKVVDMFYFPLIDTVWPDWMPFVGGNKFRFFNAIFNFADASITIGVCLLVISAFVRENQIKKDNEF